MNTPQKHEVLTGYAKPWRLNPLFIAAMIEANWQLKHFVPAREQKNENKQTP